MAPLAHGLAVDASPWIGEALPQQILKARPEIGNSTLIPKKLAAVYKSIMNRASCMPHQKFRRDSTLSWSDVRSDQTNCTAGGGDLKGQLGSASLHRQEAQPGIAAGDQKLVEW